MHHLLGSNPEKGVAIGYLHAFVLVATLRDRIDMLFILPAPGLAACAHTEIDELAYILEKTVNANARALSYLNDKVNQIRIRVLSNRATTDYLLLKNQIGCEKLQGICFFNLTDNLQLSSKGD